MKKCVSIAAIAGALLTAPLGGALAQGSITITRSEMGAVRLDLGQGVILNKDSELRRQWVTMHNPKMPVDLKDTQCVSVEHRPARTVDPFRYSGSYFVIASEPVTAFEVRFMLFDVFGTHMRTLSATELSDLEAGLLRNFGAKWRLYGENEARKYFTCISYVAQVRTAAGVVHVYDAAAALVAARQLFTHVKAEDLEPEKDDPRP